MGLEIISLDRIGRYVVFSQCHLVAPGFRVHVYRDVLMLIVTCSGIQLGGRLRLLWSKITASVDGNDKDKKNFSGIQCNRFLFIHSVQLGLSLHSKTSTCNPGTCTTSTLAELNKPKYKARSRVFGTSFVSHNMVSRVTVPGAHVVIVPKFYVINM